MTLVVNGEVVAGTVRTPEAIYRIRPVGNGLHAVSQIDPSQLPPLGEPILGDRSSRASTTSTSTPSTSSCRGGSDETETPRRRLRRRAAQAAPVP